MKTALFLPALFILSIACLPFSNMAQDEKKDTVGVGFIFPVSTILISMKRNILSLSGYGKI